MALEQNLRQQVCLVCKEYPDNAYSAGCGQCDYLLCEGCLDSCQGRCLTCPKRRKRLDRMRNRPLESLLAAVQDTCGSCGECYSLRDSKRHACECPFEAVVCSNHGCRWSGIRSQAEAHLRSECMYHQCSFVAPGTESRCAARGRAGHVCASENDHWFELVDTIDATQDRLYCPEMFNFDSEEEEDEDENYNSDPDY